MIINLLMILMLSLTLEKAFELKKPYDKIMICMVIISAIAILFNTFNLLF